MKLAVAGLAGTAFASTCTSNQLSRVSAGIDAYFNYDDADPKDEAFDAWVDAVIDDL